MITPDEQWWDAQAGEYVLGTLRGNDRDIFKRIMLSDNEIRAKVQWWQDKLSPLDSQTTPVNPPAYLLPFIMQQISDQVADASKTSVERNKEQSLSRTSPAREKIAVQHRRSSPSSNNNFNDSNDNNFYSKSKSRSRSKSRNKTGGKKRDKSEGNKNSNSLWKAIAGLATAASVAMAMWFLQTTKFSVPPPAPATAVINAVSVLQNEEREVLWVITADTNNNQLSALALAPPPIEANQSYQLWMVQPDEAGVNSVGLLPMIEGDSIDFTLPISIVEAQLFAVSLEPTGGSPEAVPTGPVQFSGTITTLSVSTL